AFVLEVIFSLIDLGLIHKLFLSISAYLTLAPNIRAGNAEAQYVITGTITSSPALIPHAQSASSIAAVPLLHAKQYLQFIYSANFLSNFKLIFHASFSPFLNKSAVIFISFSVNLLFKYSLLFKSKDMLILPILNHHVFVIRYFHCIHNFNHF